MQVSEPPAVSGQSEIQPAVAAFFADRRRQMCQDAQAALQRQLAFDVK